MKRASSAAPSAADQQPARAEIYPRWERWAVRVVLVVFVAAGINLIHNLAFIGQDYTFHVACTESLMQNPGQWFTFDITNRPLTYWIGAACAWFTHGRECWDLASLLFVFLNALALGLLHDSTRRFIASPLLRVAAVTFVAFLPPTLVTTVVYAADATAQLPFVLVAWSLLRSIDARTTFASAGYAGLAGLTLCVGNLAKFTFIFLPVAVVLAAVLLWRWKRITGQRGWIIGILAAAVPMIASGCVYLAAQRGVSLYLAALREAQGNVSPEKPRHDFDWKGTGEMTWSSLLLVKPSDARIFQAPGYYDPPATSEGSHPLLAPNDYSYPALLHLGVFTDVLGYAEQGATNEGKFRSEPQQTMARRAVWLGLLFSVPAFVAVVALGGRALRALFGRGRAPPTGPLLWWIMALIWYLPLVLALPFLHHAYEWGYWLPRLVLPALWGFALVLFAAIDEFFPRRRGAAAAVAALVLLQAAVHIRSVWF
jgi:hypothetical protein